MHAYKQSYLIKQSRSLIFQRTLCRMSYEAFVSEAIFVKDFFQNVLWVSFSYNLCIIYIDHLVISTMDYFTLGTYFKAFKVTMSQPWVTF